MSVWRAAAFPIAQLGAAAFFIGGVVAPTLGASAGWFVLAATALAALLRAIDIESWAFLIPGGLVRRVANAFGGRAARAATAVTLVERLVFGALASVVVGHYIADVLVMAIAGLRFEGATSTHPTALPMRTVRTYFPPATASTPAIARRSRNASIASQS